MSDKTLPPPTSRRCASPFSLRTYLTEPIDTTNADYLLLFVSLGVGIIDAFTFPDLKVFAANMTGNTVFLALAAAQVNDDFLSAPRSAVALASFWCGSFVSGQVGHRVGTRTRWWVSLTFCLQGLLILAAAIVLWRHGVSPAALAALDPRVLSLVTLLSFSYGAQATTARGLGVAEIPTVVITSAMVDLFGDRNLFARHNRPRNRRVGFVLAVFLGGFLGGWVYGRVDGAWTIFLAAAVKLLAVPMVLSFSPAVTATAKQ